jgi:hypothetical protein
MSSSFANVNHDEGVTLSSAWTPHWRMTVGGNSYQRAGTDAGKFVAALTAKLPTWGALTVGGAIGDDNGDCKVLWQYLRGDMVWKELKRQGPQTAGEAPLPSGL